jgi:membrane-bound lytic murein transglycosylase B
MLSGLCTLAALLLGVLTAAPARADYSTDPRAAGLYADLRSNYGFTDQDIAWVRKTLAQAQALPELIKTEQTAKEKTLTWDAYEPIHVNDANIARGVAFMRENARWLARAEADYGVPPQVVTAVLGVETKYGGFTGRVRTLDALATMGFDHPTRGAFFRGELEQLFVLCRRDKFDPLTLRGSYAGALGDAQFMPSNYLTLGVDYDGNGRVDLWSTADAIGSVANYLAHSSPDHDWQRGEPLYLPAKTTAAIPESLPRNSRRADLTVGALNDAGITLPLRLPTGLAAGLIELKRDDGADYWVGLPNFYRVLSYNPRVFYAASVAALADALVRNAAVASR